MYFETEVGFWKEDSILFMFFVAQNFVIL